MAVATLHEETMPRKITVGTSAVSTAALGGLKLGWPRSSAAKVGQLGAESIITERQK